MSFGAGLRWAVAGGSAMLSTLVGLFLLAALVGSRVPVERRPSAPSAEVLAYVASNGVHTSLVVPVRAAGIDWRRVAPVDDVRRTGLAPTHYAFGWGDRAFYLATPTWSEFELGLAVGAAIGGRQTLVHVDHLGPPVPGPDMRAVPLSAAQYRRLATHIAATFAPAPDGRPIPVPGYGEDDVFYAGRGRYSALRTCNEWVREGLAAAGVRVGGWTPFAGGVMRWL